MYTYRIGIALVAVLLWSLGFSQQIVKDKDYILVYGNHSITLQFNENKMPTAFRAINHKTKLQVNVETSGTDYILSDLAPAEIIEMEYQFSNERSTLPHRAFLASPSVSSGAIEVLFNHEVNTAFSQIQPATNLANTLDDRLIAYINACQNTLDIAIYNSASPSGTAGIAGAINAAYTRGVQIRIIYDGSTSSTMLPLLNSAIPILPSPTSSSYGIMHNKFVIFDAGNSDANKPLVWTGSTNWTTAQIDGPDRNSAIVIQDQALALGYTLEFEEMWGSTTMTPDLGASKFGPYKTDNTPHHYIIGGKAVDSYFSPSDDVTARIIDVINSANTDVDVATMLITRTDIRTALLNKYNSGMTNVNVVVDSQNPSGNQITNIQTGLAPNHAVVYTGSGILHHKFMVVDNFNAASDPQVVLGSHNWSTSAETKNDENTLVVHDLNIANQYYQAFAYLYQFAGGEITLAVPQFVAAYFSMYPNPTSGTVTINTSATPLENVTISVYNLLGQTVTSQYFSILSNTTINLSDQANGMYVIKAHYDGGDFMGKIIKQ